MSAPTEIMKVKEIHNDRDNREHQKLSYADIAAKFESSIPHEELSEIIQRLETVDIIEKIADVTSLDPEQSSRVTPYYRNLKHKTFSVFNTIPDDLEIIQDFNMYLISQIHKAKLTRIDFPKPGLKTNLKFVKIGKTTEINNIISELIFLFRLKQDIDYENSRFKGFSSVGSWLFKTIAYFKKQGGDVLHVVLSPKDHKFLVENLKTESDTLAYRAFLQMINLLCYIYWSADSRTDFKNRIGDILSNKIAGFVIKRNLTDTSDIEPYYIWTAITTPEERGVLIKRVEDNFFNEQNRLLREYRSSNSNDAALKLRRLKEKVDSRLSNNVKAVIYGRLRFYNDLKSKDDSVKKILHDRKGTKQLAIGETLRYARERKVLSLFATENIVATCHNVILKPTEIMDLTRNVYLDPVSDRMFYYSQDVTSCVTYKDLATKRAANNINLGESALLQSIESRMIQFVPGIHKRD